MQGEIRNVQGERLDYSYHEGNGNSQDLVVIGHGVTGNKDRPFVVALAEGLAQSGVSALRVSFLAMGTARGVSKTLQSARKWGIWVRFWTLWRVAGWYMWAIVWAARWV